MLPTLLLRSTKAYWHNVRQKPLLPLPLLAEERTQVKEKHFSHFMSMLFDSASYQCLYPGFDTIAYQAESVVRIPQDILSLLD